MSIINDALKKTQKAVPSVKASALGGTGTPDRAPSPAPDSREKPGTAPRPALKKPVYLLSAALLLAAAAGAAFFLAQRIDALGQSRGLPEQAVAFVPAPRHQPKSPLPGFLPAASVTTDRPVSTGKPLNPDSLVLSGIMMMGDGQAALINNNIYQIGDEVEGYEILEITLQAVKLRKNNETVFIKARNY